MKLLIASISLVLMGCASTAPPYVYDGTRYKNKNAFATGVNSKLAETVNSITPLPNQLTDKTLLFAIPSQTAIEKTSFANMEKLNGRALSASDQSKAQPNFSANYNGLKTFHDLIVRRNIYSKVKFIEINSTELNIQASATEDVLYYSEAQVGAGQWYYTSQKAGKQAFSFDRGGPNMVARSKAFIDAVQVFAVRD